MPLHPFRRENPIYNHCLKRPTDKDSSYRHKEERQLGMCQERGERSSGTTESCPQETDSEEVRESIKDGQRM